MNKGFLIYIIHAKDSQKLANMVINAKQSIEQCLQHPGSIVLDIKDFFNNLPGGNYETGFQKEGIDPEIQRADLIVIIINNEAGQGGGLEHEIGIINERKLPFICFVPKRLTEGKRLVNKKLVYDRSKNFLVTYNNQKEFQGRFVGDITRCASREIQKLNQREEILMNKGGEKKAQTSSSRKAMMKLSKTDDETVKDQFKSLFASDEIKYKYYYAFIDFLEPIYLNDHGEEKRKKLRELFNIRECQEREFLKKMKAENLIDIIGDLCVVKNENYAREVQKEIIEKGILDLQIILKLFT